MKNFRRNLNSIRFEEEFAYSLSKSYLRKTLSPVTQRPTDSILYIFAAVVSLTSDLPVFPRWISFFSKFPFYIMMLLGLLRLFFTKRVLARAKKVLQSGGIKEQNILPILFRLMDEEIVEISNLFKRKKNINDYIKEKAKSNLRWKLIQKCYL